MNEAKYKASGNGRRDLLKLLAASWAILAAVPVLNVIVRYLLPLPTDQDSKVSLAVATVDDIPKGSSRIFRFQKEPVVVVHTNAGQYEAFSARCTHLGCVVQYIESTPRFECHCHGSVFDSQGRNVSGPAPRPLAPFKVKVEGKSLFLTKV